MDYKAPLRDIQFVMHELWQAEEQWSKLPKYAEVNAELADTILDEAAKIAENVVAPLSINGHEQGARLIDGDVKTPDGFPSAWKTYAAGGWPGLSGNTDYEGQGMPKMLMVAFEEMLHAADVSFTVYSVLTTGAALAIDAHATEELKTAYLPQLYGGASTGVMALTESHAGTDLGVMRTRAEREEDGSYRVTGSKIFITGGDSDLADNVVHLVLAKLSDAPDGVKGISLFLVPKYLPSDSGQGERNSFSVGSIEHKMGINASATCVMNYDSAKGWMVGEENKGLAAMFTMMNYERLSMGMQGIGCSELALQRSRSYANERLQGRAATGAVNPSGYADPIIVHPDVRRMLLTQRAWVEAGRAFTSFVALQLDIVKSGSEEARAHAEQLVALLTPVAKAFVSDRALEGCVMGQQVFGGHGYVREWGMEQLVRDVRIAQIYEGANGIQALDLMGRKVVRSGGTLLAPWLEEIRGWASSQTAGNEFVAPLSRVTDDLESLSVLVMESAGADADAVGAASYDYLNAFGMVSYAYMWARMGTLAAEHSTDEFYESKLATAKFFYQRLLPLFDAYASAIRSGSESIMNLSAEKV